MSIPYKHEMQSFLNRDVLCTIDRDGAPPVVGKVTRVDDDGCVVSLGVDDAKMKSTYIDFRDIRGVSSVD